MRKVTLGTSGASVSALCLGAMYFGTKEDAATSRDLLDRFVAAGGDFIDTANIYAHWRPNGHGGESETLLGEWMRERGNRDQLFIATKVGFAYPGIEVGLSARQVEEECNKSLKRLGIDTIDLFYAHVDDRSTPLEETLEAFSRLVTAGKVRFIGASNYRAWRLEQARWISETRGWPAYCCVQQRHTYLRPHPGADFGPQVSSNPDLLDYSRESGVTILAYSALLGGSYARADRPLPAQYQSNETEARMAALRAVAAETGATVHQVILAWMMGGSPSVLPLIAASTREQLDENIGALAVQLSPAQIDRLTNTTAD